MIIGNRTSPDTGVGPFTGDSNLRSGRGGGGGAVPVRGRGDGLCLMGAFEPLPLELGTSSDVFSRICSSSAENATSTTSGSGEGDSDLEDEGISEPSAEDSLALAAGIFTFSSRGADLTGFAVCGSSSDFSRIGGSLDRPSGIKHVNQRIIDGKNRRKYYLRQLCVLQRVSQTCRLGCGILLAA